MAEPAREESAVIEEKLDSQVDRQIGLWLRQAVRSPYLVGWVLVFFWSGFIRLLLIDQSTLTESEATVAVWSWLASMGQLDMALSSTASPLLQYLMTIRMFVFGATEVTPHLVPAGAGMFLLVSPALLSATITKRGALAAAFFIGSSPLAIEVARTVDGAGLVAACTMLALCSAYRYFTDRPFWSVWTLAAALGLGVTSGSAFVVAILSAGAVAVGVWGRGPFAPRPRVRRARHFDWQAETESPHSELQGQDPRTWAAPLGFGLALALLGATGLLMDLGGVGFLSGGVWGGIGAVLTPAQFPSRNFAAALVYGGPVLLVALVEFIHRVRQGDDGRLALFLGSWTALLLVLAAFVGENELALAILPLGPAALLAGCAVQRLPTTTSGYRVGASSWAAILVTLLCVTGVTFTLALTLGAASQPGIFAALGIAVLVALCVVLWSTQVPSDERAMAGVILGGIAFLVLSCGTVARLSLEGSPPGSELLPREKTDPAFREALRMLALSVNPQSGVVFVYDSNTPMVARWYARAFPQLPSASAGTRSSISVRTAPPRSGSTRLEGAPRIPWKTTSELKRDALNPLGVARWLITRRGLFEGNSTDIIIVR